MSSTLIGKTFLLGPGCQKGGTTWLHDYLAGAPCSDFGPIKEYHIFDEIDLKDERSRLKRSARLERKAARGIGSQRSPGHLRLKFRSDAEEYFDFFADMLRADGIRLTGDITPAYSGLSADRFAMIAEGFARRDIKVKVVFLMRDPVERIWSAVRMELRKKVEAGRAPEPAGATDDMLVLDSYRQEAVRFRTDYRHTIGALERVFARGDILYAFYEQLFTTDMTVRICDFLGIPWLEPDFDKSVNASPKGSEISAEVASRVAQSYADIYRFAAARFGADLIRDIWPHARHVAL